MIGCLTRWNYVYHVLEEIDNAVRVHTGIWIFKGDLILLWRIKYLKRLKCDSCKFKICDTDGEYCYKDPFRDISCTKNTKIDPWINCKDYEQN